MGPRAWPRDENSLPFSLLFQPFPFPFPGLMGANMVAFTRRMKDQDVQPTAEHRRAALPYTLIARARSLHHSPSPQHPHNPQRKRPPFRQRVRPTRHRTARPPLPTALRQSAARAHSSGPSSLLLGHGVVVRLIIRARLEPPSSIGPLREAPPCRLRPHVARTHAPPPPHRRACPPLPAARATRPYPARRQSPIAAARSLA